MLSFVGYIWSYFQTSFNLIIRYSFILSFSQVLVNFLHLSTYWFFNLELTLSDFWANINYIILVCLWWLKNWIKLHFTPLSVAKCWTHFGCRSLQVAGFALEQEQVDLKSYLGISAHHHPIFTANLTS